MSSDLCSKPAALLIGVASAYQHHPVLMVFFIILLVYVDWEYAPSFLFQECTVSNIARIATGKTAAELATSEEDCIKAILFHWHHETRIQRRPSKIIKGLRNEICKQC